MTYLPATIRRMSATDDRPVLAVIALVLALVVATVFAGVLPFSCALGWL